MLNEGTDKKKEMKGLMKRWRRKAMAILRGRLLLFDGASVC